MNGNLAGSKGWIEGVLDYETKLVALWLPGWL